MTGPGLQARVLRRVVQGADRFSATSSGRSPTCWSPTAPAPSSMEAGRGQRVIIRGSAAAAYRADPPALTRCVPSSSQNPRRRALRRRARRHPAPHHPPQQAGGGGGDRLSSCSRTGHDLVSTQRCSGSAESPDGRHPRGARGLQRALPGPGSSRRRCSSRSEEQRRSGGLNRLVGIDEHVTLEVWRELRVAGPFEGGGGKRRRRYPAVRTKSASARGGGRGRIAAGAPLALAVGHPSSGRVAAARGRAREPGRRPGRPAAADRALRRCAMRLTRRARAGSTRHSRSWPRPWRAPGSSTRAPTVCSRACAKVMPRISWARCYGIPHSASPRGPDRRHYSRGAWPRYDPALDARPLRVRGLRPDRGPGAEPPPRRLAPCAAPAIWSRRTA